MVSSTKTCNKYSVASSPYPLPGSPVLIKGSIHEIMQRAKHLKYDAVELHLRSPEDMPASEILQSMQEFGIGVSAVATGLACLLDKLLLIDRAEDARNKAIVRLQQFVEWASVLKTGVIVGSMRGNLSKDAEERKRDLDLFSDSLRKVAVFAHEHSVPIFLECINRYENNYLNTAKECKLLIQSLQTPGIHIHLDTFHMNIEEDSLHKSILTAESDLGYFHVADNTRRACGTGNLDFSQALATLRGIKYDGFITVECLPLPSGDEAAKHSIDYLKDIENTLDQKELL